MKKDHRRERSMSVLLKVLVVILAAVLIYSGLDFSTVLKPEAGYVFPFSNEAGDSARLFADASFAHKRTKIPILSCGSEEKKPFIGAASASVLQRGYYPQGVDFPAMNFPVPGNLQSSLYYISDTIPFIVKPSGKTEILAVFPFLTRIAQSSWTTRSFISDNKADTLSLKTPIMFHKPDHDFSCWLRKEFPQSGMIADTDLPGTDLSATKLLIFPGNLAYATREMTSALKAALEQGVNLLVIADKFFDYQVRINDEDQMLYYDHPNRDPLPDTAAKAIRQYYLPGPASAFTGLSLFKGGIATEGSKLVPLAEFPWNKKVPGMETGRSAWIGPAPLAGGGNVKVIAEVPVIYEGSERPGIIAEISFGGKKGKIFVFGSTVFLNRMEDPQVQEMLGDAVRYLSAR